MQLVIEGQKKENQRVISNKEPQEKGTKGPTILEDILNLNTAG